MYEDKKDDRLPVSKTPVSSRRRPGPIRWLLSTVAAVIFLWIFLSRDDAAWEKRNARGDELWKWDGVREIYAFGDSWTTTEFDPNGAQPREENPMGNPEFPSDHMKRPPDWIEYMTGVYNQSSIRTYNLARGAATIDRDLVLPLFPSTWCFDEQVNDQFNSRYTKEASSPPPGRLFIVLFGLVDIALLTREGPVDTMVLEKIIGRYEDALHQLYTLGARHFLLLNIPPIERAPDPDNPLALMVAVQTFNAQLSLVRERMRIAHGDNPDFRIRVFDMHTFLEDLLYNPAIMEQTKDVVNVTQNCWEYNPDVFAGEKAQPWDYLDAEKCGVRRDQYFWANTLHVTHPVQEAIAARIIEDCFGAASGPGRMARKHGGSLCV